MTTIRSLISAPADFPLEMEIPEDTDEPSAALFNVPYEALADAVAWLYGNLIGVGGGTVDNLHVLGTLDVDGSTTLNGYLEVAGNGEFGGTLQVGANLLVTGDATCDDITCDDIGCDEVVCNTVDTTDVVCSTLTVASSANINFPVLSTPTIQGPMTFTGASGALCRRADTPVHTGGNVDTNVDVRANTIRIYKSSGGGIITAGPRTCTLTNAFDGAFICVKNETAITVTVLGTGGFSYVVQSSSGNAVSVSLYYDGTEWHVVHAVPFV